MHSVEQTDRQTYVYSEAGVNDRQQQDARDPDSGRLGFFDSVNYFSLHFFLFLFLAFGLPFFLPLLCLKKANEQWDAGEIREDPAEGL